MSSDGKIQISLVYGPQQGPPAILYENEQAVLWTSATRQEGMANVGMGFYSLPNPGPED